VSSLRDKSANSGALFSAATFLSRENSGTRQL
jgi:hypothetical protein